MAEWFANMNIALHRIDTAGKTTRKQQNTAHILNIRLAEKRKRRKKKKGRKKKEKKGKKEENYKLVRNNF